MRRLYLSILITLLAAGLWSWTDTYTHDHKEISQQISHIAPVKPLQGSPVKKLAYLASVVIIVPPAPIDSNTAKQYIYDHESGNCVTKWQGQHTCPSTYSELYNPSTAGIGYGLCQSTPAIKMADPAQGGGADWQTSYATQDKWCSDYAQRRYGGWQQAYQHWLTYHSW